MDPLGAGVLPGERGLERVAVALSRCRRRPARAGRPGRRRRRRRAAGCSVTASSPSGRARRARRPASTSSTSTGAVRIAKPTARTVNPHDPVTTRSPARTRRGPPSDDASGLAAVPERSTDRAYQPVRRRDGAADDGAGRPGGRPLLTSRRRSRSAACCAASPAVGPPAPWPPQPLGDAAFNAPVDDAAFIRQGGGVAPSQGPSQLASRAAPASPDFSGWNWVAHSGAVLDRGHERSPPCSDQVTVGTPAHRRTAGHARAA